MPDVVYRDFEWDEAKARYNIRVHEISFVDAVTVFDDPFAVVKKSQEHSIGEFRYVIIGLSEVGQLVVVTYTPRGRTRIISARKLTARERRDYESKEEL